MLSSVSTCSLLSSDMPLLLPASILHAEASGGMTMNLFQLSSLTVSSYLNFCYQLRESWSWSMILSDFQGVCFLCFHRDHKMFSSTVAETGLIDPKVHSSLILQWSNIPKFYSISLGLSVEHHILSYFHPLSAMKITWAITSWLPSSPVNVIYPNMKVNHEFLPTSLHTPLSCGL